MQRKHIVSGAVAAAILLAVSAFASPWWSLYSLRAAVERHDAEAVSAHVDFPALRDSLKGQLMTAMQQAVRGDDNLFARLGAAMAAAALGPVVDAMVSPAGVMAMLETGKVKLAKPSAPAEAEADTERRPDWSLHYRGWNGIAAESDAPRSARFIFRREGLWGWKLAAIELPPSS